MLALPLVIQDKSRGCGNQRPSGSGRGAPGKYRDRDLKIPDTGSMSLLAIQLVERSAHSHQGCLLLWRDPNDIEVFMAAEH